MKKTAISLAYHSGYGHTERIAHAVADGAGDVEGASVTLHDVTAMTDATWETLDAADAIIFGSPTYMGTTSKEFSAFSQQSSGPWFEKKWVGKVAGGFTVSLSPSGDKSNVFNVLMTLANQHGMLWVSLGHGPGLGDPNTINRMATTPVPPLNLTATTPVTTPPKGTSKLQSRMDDA